MTSDSTDLPGPAARRASVDLYWIPLGAGVGGELVRYSGRLYEFATAAIERREAQALYHSALVIRRGGIDVAIEMAPVWLGRGERGIVSEGPVGARLLGRWALFRYGVRRWVGGSIPDAAAAIGGALPVTDDPVAADRLFDLVPSVPTATWGRDELRTGEMWNSNSLTSWLLVRADLDADRFAPPPGGRAPGWHAGLVAARRS